MRESGGRDGAAYEVQLRKSVKFVPVLFAEGHFIKLILHFTCVGLGATGFAKPMRWTAVKTWACRRDLRMGKPSRHAAHPANHWWA